jgi:CRISPR type IV-associated protein Csf2
MFNEIKRRTVTIRGVLTLTAATHQTSPEKKEGMTPQMKTSVVVHRGDVRLLDGVPFITANSARALLRRACGEVLMEEIERAKNQISRALYLSIQRGGYGRTAINAGGASYQQLVAAQDHIFAGLFGGGAFMYPSKVFMDRDLFPMLESLRHLFPKRDQESCFAASPKDIIGISLIASKDDFAKLPKHNVIEDHANAHQEHMASKFADNLAKREQKEAGRADGVFISKEDKLKTDDLNTYTEVEVIVPGTPLYFSATLADVTDSQIGLVLLGLQAWANRNALGGGAVRGRGSFTAELRMEEDGKTIIEHLLLDDAPASKLSDTTHSFIAKMRQDLEEAAQPAVLGAIYPTDIFKKEKKAGKKGAPALDAAQGGAAAVVA